MVLPVVFVFAVCRFNAIKTLLERKPFSRKTNIFRFFLEFPGIGCSGTRGIRTCFRVGGGRGRGLWPAWIEKRNTK